MADEYLSISLLHSLPKSYEHIVACMAMNEREMHTQDVVCALTYKHMKRTASKTYTIKDEMSAFSTKRNVQKCTYCGKDDHFRK